MPTFVLDIENLSFLLRIHFEPFSYGRVITVTSYIRLLYRGAIVVEVPIRLTVNLSKKTIKTYLATGWYPTIRTDLST